jgi:cytochrome c5
LDNTCSTPPIQDIIWQGLEKISQEEFMKKSMFILVIVFALSAIVLSACGGSSDSGSTSVIRPETPSEYTGLTNPLTGNADAITSGKALYDANCASCHGDAGLGDGVAGTQLEPKPANLVSSAKETTVGYLYFRILKGGMMDPINSSMPSQEGLLAEEQIWQLVSYIESWK